MHLVKAYVGTGIFSMGDAMKNSGLLIGPITTFVIGMVCLHCAHLLVNSAHKLHKHYNLERIPDYAEAAKLAFALAAPNFPAGAFVAKLTVNVFLIMAQMGFCSCYLVFISWNIRELMNAYKYTTDIHWIIVLVTIPIWITCWIRTLKCLAYLSVVANFTLLTSIGIVLYYALIKPTSQCPVGLNFPGVTEFAIFFGQSIFAFEGIGLVLILYNEMSEPEQFNETYGVLNIGLHLVTITYIFFGAVTYLQFGVDTKETVTLNLDTSKYLAQFVLLLISLGVSFSFSLQLYVAVDITWPKIVYWLGPFRYPNLAEFWFRTALVLTIFVMAEAVPRLQILLSFVGAFLSVALIAIFPALIDITAKYAFGEMTWMVVIKNGFIIAFGVVGTVAGTYESLVLLSKEI